MEKFLATPSRMTRLGNITSTANVGTYAYPSSGYGAVRPHAVSSITGTVAGLTNPGFSYDANGNLVNGLNRAYTWTAADMPLSIDKVAGGQAVQRTEFVYGPDHERVRQVVRTMSGGQPQGMVNTVIYAGGGGEGDRRREGRDDHPHEPGSRWLRGGADRRHSDRRQYGGDEERQVLPQGPPGLDHRDRR